jgi:Zn-dependent peptidase ImmA (M78 family)
MPGDRQRFTVAHELGHIIMHSLSEFPNEESEKQADEFASELLMPRLDIAGNFNKLSLERLMDLKKYWKVSMQALIYRAKSLNRISAYKAQILWKQISMYGYKKNEPIKIEKETPRIFAELVDSHKQELGYSENELSSLLNLKADEFRNKYSKSSHCHLRVL